MRNPLFVYYVSKNYITHKQSIHVVSNWHTLSGHNSIPYSFYLWQYARQAPPADTGANGVTRNFKKYLCL